MTPTPTHSLLIAIPNYDCRVFPRFDQAREFYFAQVNLEQQRIVSLDCHRYPQHHAQRCRWLQEQGIQGVICSGIHRHHQLQLQHYGIWLNWGITGEIEAVLQHWLQEPHSFADDRSADSKAVNFSSEELKSCNEVHSI